MTYYYYSVCGQPKLSDFSVMSLLVYCFIRVVVCDGWLAICLSVCISLTISLSHTLILSFPFPPDQLSVYSVLYTAVPQPTGIANSFQQWRQRDRLRTQGVQEGQRE